MRLSDIIYYPLLCLTGLLVFSCSKVPNYPVEPVLKFVSINKTTLLQGSFEDTARLTLMFTDGDGDLGNKEELNIFFFDLRDTSFPFTQYRIPFIPEEGAANGISGEIILDLESSCCIYESGQAPCTPSDEVPADTVIYEVHIVDRAGNESNRVLLPPITLLCD